MVRSIIYFINPLKTSLISKEYYNKNKHILLKKKLIDSFTINYLLHKYEYEYNMILNATIEDQLHAIKKYYEDTNFTSNVEYCMGFNS